MKALIEGHLTHSEDQNRYLLDDRAAFAQLASAIHAGIPCHSTPDGLDYGRVRITVEVVEEETEDEEE